MVEKIVHLNALDLDVPVPENIFYFDEGFKQDVLEYRKELYKKYGCIKYLKKIEKDNEILINGLHSYLKEYNGSRFFHIYYLNKLNDQQNFLIRSHEETHFLHAIKKLPLLSEKISREVGVLLDFEEIRNKYDDRDTRLEVVAELGGIFGVHRRYSFQEAIETSKKIENVYIGIARELYIEAYSTSLKNARKSSRKGLSKILNLFE